MNAAKKKSLPSDSLAVLRFLLVLAVTLLLPETRVRAFAGSTTLAPGKIASVSASSLGGIAVAFAYDASGSLVAAEGGGTDIALGAGNAGTRTFAQNIGADHLLDLPESQWKGVFQSYVADPSTTFHVNMNGFFGDTPEEMIMNEMQYGRNTGWELQQLQNAGRLPEVKFYLPGTTTPISNPF